jgi:hypothetical protein
LAQFKYKPAEALEAVAAQNDAGWRDVDIFSEGDGDGSDSDGGSGDNDGDSMTPDSLSSSEIEGFDRENEPADFAVHEEQTFTDSDDDRSGEGSQGTYGRVSHIFVDASFNDLGASVRRALHGEALTNACVSSVMPHLLLQRRRCSAVVCVPFIFPASIMPRRHILPLLNPLLLPFEHESDDCLL